MKEQVREWRNEGFGLPPLEAMHFGCPVICSRAASVPEVAGDAALYCNALDVNDIAACLRRIIEEDALRRTLTENDLPPAAVPPVSGRAQG